MLLKSRWARRGVSVVTATGLTASLAIALPIAASADATVVTFSSTDPTTYTSILLDAAGGGGGSNWAPWVDDAGLNAPGVSGSTNWRGSAWTQGWAVQDDGSGSNNALWVQKAQAAAPSNGMSFDLGPMASMISSSSKVISVRVKAADAYLPVEAILSDGAGRSAITATAVAVKKDQFNTLTFNFAYPDSGSFDSSIAYSKLALVFDPDNVMAGKTHDDWGQGTVSATNSKLYIVDDLAYTPVAINPTKPYKLTYEDNDEIGALAYGDINPDAGKYAGQFEGGYTGSNGSNALPGGRSGKALEFNKFSGGQDWSGFVAFAAGEGEVITTPSYKTISFDYYSPDASASPVTLQLERSFEPEYGAFAVKKTFVAAPGWNTFTVDVSTMSNYDARRTLVKMIIFPDFGTAEGATVAAKTSQKYYIDNLTFNGWGLATKVTDPSLSGSARVSSTLTANVGSWTGNGITYSYAWYRCTVKGSSVRGSAPITADRCTVISGKTASTYKLTSSDRGKYIRAKVTATTSAGSVVVTTKSTTVKVG